MNTKPILFSAPMVRALLNGTKKQTRRVMKTQPTWREVSGELQWWQGLMGWETVPACVDFPQLKSHVCPHGKTGDQLWVKETHLPKSSGIIYRADYDPVEAAGLGGMYGGWKPSIFCRREYSRITLEITGVTAERLQDISEADCAAEGVSGVDGALGSDDIATASMPPTMSWPIRRYALLWHSINGKQRPNKPDISWQANPWVWCLSFTLIQP